MIADLLNGLAFGMLVFILAVGLALVFGVMDVLNLAHGAAYLMGAYLAYRLVGEVSGTAMGLLAAALASAAAGALIGLILAGLTAGRRAHLDQALLTLGVALVVGELLTMVFGDDVHAVAAPVPLHGTARVLGDGYPVYRVALIGVGAVIALAAHLILDRTRAGALIRAVVADREMVAALGVDVRRALPLVFAVGCALAAVAGVLGAPVLGAEPALDDQVLLLALVAVVVGGIGSVTGTLAGALFVGQVEVLGRTLLPGLASFLLFGAMALVLVVRPAGLVKAAG